MLLQVGVSVILDIETVQVDMQQISEQQKIALRSLMVELLRWIRHGLTWPLLSAAGGRGGDPW